MNVCSWAVEKVLASKRGAPSAGSLRELGTGYRLRWSTAGFRCGQERRVGRFPRVDQLVGIDKKANGVNRLELKLRR
jgi:hypothetical protein